MKNYSTIKSLAPILLGFSIWLLIVADRIPYSIFELSHVEILLIAAPLWLIPLAFHIIKKPNWLIWIAVSCGLLFATAYHFPKGIYSSLFILPWLIYSLIFLFKKLNEAILLKKNKLHEYVELAAYLYLPVGIIWAAIDRLDIPFLGYDPTIILLTGVHFHYAGFILPLVTSWLVETKVSIIYKLTAIGIIIGIPLVALGISSSHFNWPVWIEVLSVSIMTLSGTLVGILHLRLGIRTKNWIQKMCFAVGGLALIAGMSLAFCYGWRHVFIIETLTIPWMYAVHGTCNAVGFAAPVLIGWKLKGK